MNFTRETVAYATEAEWLALREKDITSTEVAGLFDSGVYTNTSTAYELHMIKSGALPPVPFEETDDTKWGTRLEASIATGIAEDLGLVVSPLKVYMRIPELRMGSSFDFQIVGLADGYSGDETARNLFRERGPGIMEVKNVRSLVFKDNWMHDGENTEAPAHIEFQVQGQQIVSGMTWTVIAPLVGGNTPKPIFRVADEPVQAAIVQAVREFWARVDAGTPPEPDYAKDAKTIKRLYVNNDGSAIDLSHDVRLAGLCKAYKEAGARAKTAESDKQAALAEILTIIGAHKSITTANGKISAGTRSEVYKCYRHEEYEKVTITISKIPATDIETTVAPYRDVRISI